MEEDKLVTLEGLKIFKNQIDSKTIYLSQSEYDELVLKEQVHPDVEYNIYEDDN